MPNYLQTSQVSRKCTQQKQTKTSSTTWCTASQYWASLRSSTSFEHQSRLSQKAKWKEKAGNFFNNLQCSKAEVADIQQVALKLKCIGARDLDLPILFLRGVWKAGARSNIHLRWKHPIHLWKPMQTRPLSKCMLLACAYQSARQRNMGIPKKSCQGVWQLFGKGRLFGRPCFKTNPQEISTLCIYPKQLLKHTKKVSINETLSITNLAHDFLSCNLWGTFH